MRPLKILLVASTALLSTPAMAGVAKAEQPAAPAAAKPAGQAFTTGVAKGRDLLDTAISASTLDETAITKIGSRSVIELIGTMPGIRAESPGVDGYASMTIRGLPLSGDGSKYLQLQEDGLPVQEFGDVHFASASRFLRSDLSLSQIQTIRGGSASTFASNSPGGIINLISKTGDENGGTVQLSSGIGYDLNRVDFNYGRKLSGGWKFNIGGFYHQGEGPRTTGYNDAFKGGQIKANITKTFDGGYVRLYLKYLDDREPNYGTAPLAVSGTNDNPRYASLPGFDSRKDTTASRNLINNPFLNETNSLEISNLHRGNESKVKSIGLEGQYDLAGWTISEKFRFSSVSGTYNEQNSIFTLPGAVMGLVLAGPGAKLAYASGPNAGQAVPNAAGQLFSRSLWITAKLNNLDNLTNDLRATRVWNVGTGKMTTTGGWYFSRQNIGMFWNFNSPVTDVVGNGQSNLIDVFTAGGAKVSQNGLVAFGLGLGPADYHRIYDAKFRINAPYGSVNYQIGKLALGGSARYDMGHVGGQIFGAGLGNGRVTSTAFDMNGNGSITGIENSVPYLALSRPGVLDYSYHYLSYSVGANYRLAEPLSIFARYSRGARAAAEGSLFLTASNPTTGLMAPPQSAFGYVKQAEGGVKFRKDNVTLFVTGFWASTTDLNIQIGADATGQPVVNLINRAYSAKGVELEGIFQHGPFGLTLSATYTKAKIDSDSSNPALNGTTPRHSASLFFSAMPQYQTERFSLGANVSGTTSSLAQDGTPLKQPGYVIVSPFFQIRPLPKVQLGITAYNVFDKLALIQVGAGTLPAGGIVQAQNLNGRTVTASLRYSF